MPKKEKLQTASASPKRRCKWFTCSKGFFVRCLCLVLVVTLLVIFFVKGIDQKLLRYLNIRQTVLKTTFSLDGCGNSESINESLYVVYNPSCQIPNYSPFHEDVKPYYQKKDPVNCTQLPFLTSVTRPGNFTFHYILNLHKEYFPYYHNETAHTKPACCFSNVVISAYNTNTTYSVHACQELDTNVRLDPSVEVVLVKCKVGEKMIYTNLHFLVVNKTNVQSKLVRTDQENPGDDILSVMIVGIDSASRLNLLRTMPLTNEYLANNSWYALQGYHKIHSNTFHNLVGPVLTGYSGEQLEDMCMLNGSAPLDSCPWIWKNYSERNYITAYGEDGPKLDSFTKYASFGTTPIDYLMRPFMLLAEVIFNITENYPVCMGPMRSGDSILDFSADFTSRFLKHPTFSLFWMNTFSHEMLNGPAMMDRKFIAYFERLKNSGVLDKSMVVFMSDHGFQRWGFRKTQMGSIEDSLPFLFLWLPKWFREKYPSKVLNLMKNKNRLTSHFDLHLTLMDVLGLKTKAAGCPECVSLFDLVPWNRSCSDAGIWEDACACTRYEPMSVNDALVTQMAGFAVNYINNQSTTYAKYLQNGTKCSKFTIRDIRSARKPVNHTILHWSSNEYEKILQSVQNKISDYIGGYKHYIIHIETQPGNALFEATVLNNITFEVKSIFRLDSYSNKTNCMLNRVGKIYCNCELESFDTTNVTHEKSLDAIKITTV